jgi:phosphoglycerol transferase MdoB-like AlkP superfamily enzyme
MLKIDHRQVNTAVKKISAVFINVTTIFTLSLLVKLLYFNSQLGDGLLIGLPGFAALGSIMILTSISWLLKPKVSIWYMSILDLILTFVVFGNVLFYRYFNDLISIPLLTQASCVSDIGSSMFQLLHLSDLILIIDFVLIPFLGKVVGKGTYDNKYRGKKYLIAVTSLVFGAIIMFTSFNQLVRSQPTILQTFYDRVFVAQNIGLLNYHAADVYAFVQQGIEENSELDEQKKQEIFKYFIEKKQTNNDYKQLNGVGKDKNLIVVQMEAIQQFVINKAVNGKEITPNLNKLAASGIYFDNYYYQTAGGGTSDAEFTANVSMFPMKEGAVYIRKPGNKYYSLPLKLKEAGYSTLAMHGYKPGFWNRSVVYKNIGFDKFYSKSNMKENELLGMGISDKDFFKQVAEKLKTQNKPYHAFLISLSSHFPYDNDKSKYSSFDVGKYKDTLLGDYLEAVHYTDEALGQFVDELKSSGMMDDTVLVLYGDHHGIPKDNEQELAEFLGKENLTPMEWQQLQKVPMIINTSGIESMTVSIAGGGVDFMPTILNIMGMDDSNQPSLGRDLINSQEGFVVLRNGSFVTDDKVYISKENICYDVKTGETISQEEYSELKQKAESLLNYSDTIIRFDLADEIKDYLEKQKP